MLHIGQVHGHEIIGLSSCRSDSRSAARSNWCQHTIDIYAYYNSLYIIDKLDNDFSA